MGKGPQYERDVCKQLSLWWSGGKSDHIFWRTSGSGARATTRSKKGLDTLNHYGDLCAIDPIGQPFTDLMVIEIKRGYSKDTIADLLDRTERMRLQTYEEWFAKILHNHKESGCYSWMLIARRNKRLPIIFTPFNFAKELRLPLSAPGLSIRFTLHETDHFVWGTTLDKFQACVLPETIKELAKRC